MSTELTPGQARNKISLHLEKGAGIYAQHARLGSRYFKARVKADVLELWDGFHWFEVPRGTQFNNGNGSSGNLFVY